MRVAAAKCVHAGQRQLHRRSAQRSSFLTLPSLAAGQGCRLLVELRRVAGHHGVDDLLRAHGAARGVHVDGDGLVHAADDVVAVVEDARRCRRRCRRRRPPWARASGRRSRWTTPIFCSFTLPVTRKMSACLGLPVFTTPNRSPSKPGHSVGSAPRCRSRCSWSRRSG